MVDIRDALHGQRAPVGSGRRCKTARLFDLVPDDQSVELERRLHDPAWTDHELARLIGSTELGHISASMLSRHRSGACICDPITEGSNA